MPMQREEGRAGQVSTRSTYACYVCLEVHLESRLGGVGHRLLSANQQSIGDRGVSRSQPRTGTSADGGNVLPYRYLCTE